MSNLSQTKKIIEAVIFATSLPVSIKCRVTVGQVSVIDFF